MSAPAVAAPRRTSWTPITLSGWAALAVVSIACARVAQPLALTAWIVPVVWAAVIDARTARLPDRIVLPGIVTVAVVLAVSALWTGGAHVSGAVAGVLILGVPFLGMHLASPEGLGFGDVKYGSLLGLGIGAVRPGAALVVFFVAALVQVAVAVARPWPAQRVPGASRRAAPFGPALAIASIGWLLVVLTTGGGG